ncbi:hypothetical protein ACST8G_25525, partial [Klebsiella pneumoniae]
AEFTIGEGELMAHDVPLGCAPDEYDDLISGTCSHLPLPLSNSLSFLWHNMTAAARHPNEVLTQWHEAGGVLTIELARQLGVPANGTPRSSSANAVLPATKHYGLLIGSAITRSSGCTCRHCTIWSLSKLNQEWLSDRSLLA